MPRHSQRIRKLTGHLGLFNLSNINFVLGKQFSHNHRGGNREFYQIKENSSKISAASHVARLVDQYTISEETDGDIFHLGLGALDYLNRKEMKALELKFFLRYFEFKFLSLLGYEPEDKTIIKAFTDSQVSLTENDLNKIEEDFSKYFRIFTVKYNHLTDGMIFLCAFIIFVAKGSHCQPDTKISSRS